MNEWSIALSAENDLENSFMVKFFGPCPWCSLILRAVVNAVYTAFLQLNFKQRVRRPSSEAFGTNDGQG